MNNIDKLKRISTPAEENWFEIAKEWEREDKEMDKLKHEVILPKGYIFKDENGNIINATKIVVEKKERFDPKTLHHYDKVLAKDGFSSKWTCTFFSHMDNDALFPVYCSGGYFKVCIPYNEETKNLAGTDNDCPEYYKWWEE